MSKQREPEVVEEEEHAAADVDTAGKKLEAQRTVKKMMEVEEPALLNDVLDVLDVLDSHGRSHGEEFGQGKEDTSYRLY